MATLRAMWLFAPVLLPPITFATQLTSSRLDKAYSVMNAVSTQRYVPSYPTAALA